MFGLLRIEEPPPQFTPDQIFPALWVLECAESVRQGTAFALVGRGLVTCRHVLGHATKAFQANCLEKKFDVFVVKENSDIDLAVLRIEASLDRELSAGSAEQARQTDPILICGFPNYRYGDTGVCAPGIVMGFRTVSTIRRFLINPLIVAGMSGSPVLDRDGKVIGVAVTGADRPETALQAEDHGVIPISALDRF